MRSSVRGRRRRQGARAPESRGATASADTCSQTTARLGEVGARVGVEHGAAAERDDGLLAQRLGDHLAFDLAEVRLALAGEDLLDRAVPLDDALVGVDERRARRMSSRAPTRDLPAPIGPTSTIGGGTTAPDRARGSAASGTDRVGRRDLARERVGDGREVALDVPARLGDRVAPELLEHGVRE